MEKLYTIAEASQMLNVAKSTLRRWDREGKLKSIRTIGGFRRYQDDIIHDLMKGPIEELKKHKPHPPFSDEHRAKLSRSKKEAFASGSSVAWCKGKKLTRLHCLKNMKVHLKYDVSVEWLNSFEDMEKLKYLNHAIRNKRDSECFTTEIYQKYIEKFYYDEKFNDLFRKWVETKDKWIKPSLDHIVAKSNNGSLYLENLQFISWLENRAKMDIKQEDWNRMKANINYYL